MTRFSDEKAVTRRIGNKLWRMMNLYKIKTKAGELRNWKPNFVQRHLLRRLRPLCDGEWNLVSPLRDIVIKYRQGGVSTFWLLWWLDEAIWNENQTIAIMAHKQEAIGYLFEIIRLAHETMPDDLRPAVGSDSVRELSFPEVGSKIMVSLEIRSTALTALHISEWCLSADKKVRASKSAVPPFGHISGESTGNGIGGDGYETYTEAVDGSNGYSRLFVPWYIQREYRIPVPPGHIVRTEDEKRLAAVARADWGIELDDSQIAFRRQTKKDLKNLFASEFPETEDDAFLASGSPFFNNQKLKVLLDEEIAAKEEPVRESSDFTLWREPVKGHIYAAGGDPADEGRDYAVLKVLDVTAREEVFRYRARVSATRFAEVCDEWGRYFNNAILGVEENNMGLAVLTKLDEVLRYPNLFVRERPRVRVRIIRGNGDGGGADTGKSKGKLGWRTDAKTKPFMLARLKDAVEGDFDDGPDEFEPEYRVRDRVFIQEAFRFSDADGKLEGQDGSHDDDVMASAIAWLMALEAGRIGERTKGLEHGRIFLGEQRRTVRTEDEEDRGRRIDRR